MLHGVIKRLTQTNHQYILDVGSMWAMYNSKDMLGIMAQSNLESQSSPIWQIPQQKKVFKGGYYSYAI